MKKFMTDLMCENDEQYIRLGLKKDSQKNMEAYDENFSVWISEY